MPRKSKVEPPESPPPEERRIEPVEMMPAGESPPPPEAPAVSLPPLPTREERLAAAAAHGSILLNLLTGIGGPVLALVLWLHYEGRSRYVAWQALQALVFQGVVLLAGLVIGSIAAALWLLTLVLVRLVVGYCFLPFTVGFSLLFGLLFLGSLFYGCAGALATLNGQEFRYRWVSDWIYRGRP
ncbi:MAG: DUF4870 domain-containing protein [Chloroflexia bacterium]